MQLTNDIINKLGLNIDKISPFTNKTYYIKTIENKKYILRYANKTQYDIYKYLEYFECDILYPKKIIEVRYGYYFLFDFLRQTSDTMSSVSIMSNALYEIHKKTSKIVTLKKDNFKNLHKMYQVLDHRFSMLEMIVRKIELSPHKDENSWIVLSKYRIFLHAKRIMYSLQNKIHQAIDKNIKVEYAINMSNPSLSHFKGGKLINYSNAYFGIVVSDIAKLYVECDHLDMDLYKIINEWLTKYENHFYKLYFKFLVVYIYLINLKIGNIEANNDIMNYIQISDRIKKAIYLFKDYK